MARRTQATQTLDASTDAPSPNITALLQGFSFTSTVFITPLFFGAAHLHHLHDLVHYQRVSPARAAAQVWEGQSLVKGGGAL